MVRLGIIGMGYTGWQHLRAAANLAEARVVAVADTDERRLAGLPPDVAATAAWQELLADDAVDAVSVCLPHAAHAEVALAALAAGKHLLLEKPLAADLEGARRIAAAAAASDRTVMVEMTHRFYPPMVAARELLAAGRAGRVYAVEDRIVQWLHPERLPGWMLRRSQAGGGVAMTNGVHMLDRIAWLCGQRLTLLSAAAGWTHRLGDVEDTAAMLLRLDDGTPVSLLASWPLGPAPRPAGEDIDDELTVYGTNGTVRVWSWRGWAFEPAAGGRQEHAGYPADMDWLARVRVGMAAALREFCAAIAARRPASPGVAAIVAAQELLDQFYRMVDAGDPRRHR